MPSGSIGSRTRDSTRTNAARKATAPDSSSTIGVDVQPSSLPRSRPSTSSARPAVSVICPGQSMRRGCGSRDSATRVNVIASAAIPIGMLIRNTHCQSRPLVSAPPTSGPTANEAPIVAP
jgi:hypothetical protein